jgi:hypothetical protein
MRALVLAALAALARGRALAGAGAAGVAAALKFVPLLLVPWIALAAARAGGGGRRGWGRAALALLVGVAPLVLAFVPLWAGGATLDGLRDRWARGRLEEAAAGPGALLVKNAVPLAAYLAMSAWLAAGRAAEGARRIVPGWIVTAGAVITATGLWLPWYLSWPFAAALTRWDARHVAASYLLFCFAAVFTFRYSVVLGGG